MTEQELLLFFQNRIKSTPKNFVEAFLTGLFCQINCRFSLFKKFLFELFSRQNAKQEPTIFSKLFKLHRIIRQLLFIAGLALLSSLSVSLFSFLGASLLLKAFGVTSALMGACYTCNFFFNFLYAHRYFCAASAPAVLLSLKEVLKVTQQERERCHERQISALMKLSKEGFSEQSLEELKAAESSLSSLGDSLRTQIESLCPGLISAFAAVFERYITDIEAERVRFSEQSQQRVQRLVESELYNQYTPWPSGQRSYLKEPAQFLALSREITRLFQVTPSYKKALLVQIRYHGLYKARLRTLSDPCPFEGQASCVESLVELERLRRFLVTLEAPGESLEVKKHLHARLDSLFWRKDKKGETIAGGLDEAFFAELKESLGSPLEPSLFLNTEKLCRFTLTKEEEERIAADFDESKPMSRLQGVCRA